MTQYLPPNLLALFAPRDAIPFIPPIEKHKNHRKLPYTGIAQFLGEFEDPSETPALPKVETREERKERKRKEKQEQANYKLERDLALWNPKKLTTGTTNAYNTLFVARLNYDTSENKLRREFVAYGPIKKICVVKDATTNKPRGYAFIEFEHERDMHAANKDANGRKIDGNRILADVERGRTRPDWRPRRLGKGLGKSRTGPCEPKREEKRRDDDRDKDRDRRKRSRSREYRDRRRRSRSHERIRSRDRSRDHGRRDKYRREEMSQYGEYGAEIKAEYNGEY